eukprot:gene6600-6828_t
MQRQAVLVACSTEANIVAWDLDTATQLAQYKANASARNCCCRLGHDYFASAQNNKDVIHFWTWHKDQVLQRCFTQEALTALAASPNGAYLAGGGTSGTLYCWEVASGRLLRSWPAHYKAVSCLQFSDSGGLLVSAGGDALVCAWLLAEVLDGQQDVLPAAAAAGTSRVEPLHTCGRDVRQLAANCFCSSRKGLQIALSIGQGVLAWWEWNPSAYALAKWVIYKMVFCFQQVTHHDQGCEDGSVRVWDLRSRQCLRVINSPSKAPVTAALLVEWPVHLSTLSQQGTGAGSDRQGPKRMQPLAPLAKFAGAASSSSSKPWEGPLVILDGQLGQTRSGSSGCGPVYNNLLPDPVTPIQTEAEVAGVHEGLTLRPVKSPDSVWVLAREPSKAPPVAPAPTCWRGKGITTRGKARSSSSSMRSCEVLYMA